MQLLQTWALATIVVLGACSGDQPAADSDNAQINSNAEIVNIASANTAVPAEEEAKKNEKVTAAAVEPKRDEATKPLEVPAPLTVKTTVEPPAAFAQCAICHDTKRGGVDKLGPNLFGIMGTKAGKHRPGFSYSDALKNSELIWDEATLDKWIENPRELVPGNRMISASIKDPIKRKEIINYLKSLR